MSYDRWVKCATPSCEAKLLESFAEAMGFTLCNYCRQLRRRQML